MFTRYTWKEVEHQEKTGKYEMEMEYNERGREIEKGNIIETGKES